MSKNQVPSIIEKTLIIKNGTPKMTEIVGTGCMAASVIGTFAAVEKDLVFASACGLACYEIAAEIAAKKSKGPGSFKENIFDAVYNLNEKTVVKMQKIVDK